MNKLIENCRLTEEERAWLSGRLPSHLRDIPNFIDQKITKAISIIRAEILKEIDDRFWKSKFWKSLKEGEA